MKFVGTIYDTVSSSIKWSKVCGGELNDTMSRIVNQSKVFNAIIRYYVTQCPTIESLFVESQHTMSSSTNRWKVWRDYECRACERSLSCRRGASASTLLSFRDSRSEHYICVQSFDTDWVHRRIGDDQRSGIGTAGAGSLITAGRVGQTTAGRAHHHVDWRGTGRDPVACRVKPVKDRSVDVCMCKKNRFGPTHTA